ncbi:MAG: tetratricopeptide repeat protein [Pyrinomonadaceae bacterium]
MANSALGECLTTQRRFDEAESLLLESYENLKNSQGAENPRTKIALRRVSMLYEDWGKTKAAKEIK